MYSLTENVTVSRSENWTRDACQRLNSSDQRPSYHILLPLGHAEGTADMLSLCINAKSAYLICIFRIHSNVDNYDVDWTGMEWFFLIPEGRRPKPATPLHAMLFCPVQFSRTQHIMLHGNEKFQLLPCPRTTFLPIKFPQSIARC